MSTLVIGASGLVGYEFYRQMGDAGEDKGEWHFTYNSKKTRDFLQLDATNADAVSEIVGELEPNLIILPAAYANVNGCETEKELARANNVGIVKNVLEAAGKSCRIVFFSTDYLFDGKKGPYDEAAKPNPINYYGKLKLECEQLLAASGNPHLIVRTTGVFGYEAQHKNFLYRVTENLGAGKTLELPNDQFANATYVRDLVSATLELLDMKKSGVYNVAGPEIFSKDALARVYAEFYGLDVSLIIGKPTSSFPSIAPRPMKGGLKTTKSEALGITVRKVREALADMKKRKRLDDSY
ncbi:MAG: SDR family oxidoreductase [Candidatus Micrarchaeota archaeon]|nr:SDR family oxidoreductase [Candidatus Micrarchaeota archaeon]